jgi:hydrogenase maturation protein HypF
MKRICHLEEFPVLSGDKMSLEPRLSALSVLHQAGLSTQRLKGSFLVAEWKIHQQQLQEKSVLKTSSMGRLMDAVSALLNIGLLNSYEGEAAMLLESAAREFNGMPNYKYDFLISGSKIIWQAAIKQVIDEINKGLDRSEIAFRFHDSLATLIMVVAEHFGIQKLTFSGGVFQNTLLCERIVAHASGRYDTYFHQKLPPNDACIANGQVAYIRKVGE